ncbi:MAG: FkbM family methyltransferase [Alphaproteobacteria bacterium]|jgi:FkbM family methyltransferase|nr:FkbM family methyltransferase [Alphaproteobacteria bacterium]
MSTRYSAFAAGVVRALVSLLGPRSRPATLARTSVLLAPDIRVETPRGELVFHTPSRAALYWPRYAFEAEPETLAWIDGFEAGEMFWDIGAGVGTYAMYAALGSGIRVLAFEPNPFTHACLVKNLALNRLADKVDALPVAISDDASIERFHMVNDEAGSVGNVLGDAGQVRFADLSGEVAAAALGISIDELIAKFATPLPDHIKIDVDSIEDKIVQGGLRTLSSETVRSVLIELDDTTDQHRAQRDRVLALMAETGLRPIARHDLADGTHNQLFER